MHKTGKTHAGTLVEIALARALRLAREPVTSAADGGQDGLRVSAWTRLSIS